MKPASKPHGEIRQSQVVMTFGPGSMLDLPNYSVLVAGLEFWSAGGRDYFEAEVVQRRLARAPGSYFRGIENTSARRTTIRGREPASRGFPVSGVVHHSRSEKSRKRGPSVRTRLLVHRKALNERKVH